MGSNTAFINTNRKKRLDRGFTLIELVVVLALFAVAASIVTPFVVHSINAFRYADEQTHMSNLSAIVFSQIRNELNGAAGAVITNAPSDKRFEDYTEMVIENPDKSMAFEITYKPVPGFAKYLDVTVKIGEYETSAQIYLISLYDFAKGCDGKLESFPEDLSEGNSLMLFVP